MKNFRFLAHPSVDGASMERRWSVDGGSMEDQTPRNCRIAELQNCTTGKTSHLARFAAMLLMLITMSVGQVWADNGDFYNVYLKWTENGNNHAQDLGTSGFTQKNYGVLTKDFVVTDVYLKCWDDWGSNYKSSGGQMCYRINGGASQYLYPFGGHTGKNGNNYEYQKENANLVIGAVNGASGKYLAEFWFQTWGWGNPNDKYLNNGGSNYKFTYTILPPNVNNFGVNCTGWISGSGTEADPYVVPKDQNLNISISGQQAHTDANSSLRLEIINKTDADAHYYGNLSDGKAYNYQVTTTDSKQLEVHGYYINYNQNTDAELQGAHSTRTIWVKAADPMVHYRHADVVWSSAPTKDMVWETDHYTCTFEDLAAGDYEFDIPNKDWSTLYKWASTNAQDPIERWGDTENLKFTLEKPSKVVLTLAKDPGGTSTPVLSADTTHLSISVSGSMSKEGDNWIMNQMTNEGGNTYTVTLSNIAAGTYDFNFKDRIDHEIYRWNSANMVVGNSPLGLTDLNNNFQFTLDQASDLTFTLTFNPDGTKDVRVEKSHRVTYYYQLGSAAAQRIEDYQVGEVTTTTITAEERSGYNFDRWVYDDNYIKYVVLTNDNKTITFTSATGNAGVTAHYVVAAPASTTWYAQCNNRTSAVFTDNHDGTYTSEPLRLGWGDWNYFWLYDGSKTYNTGSNNNVDVVTDQDYVMAVRQYNGFRIADGTYTITVNPSANTFRINASVPEPTVSVSNAPEYIIANIANQLSFTITSSGASAGWYYRVHNRTNNSYYAPDEQSAATNTYNFVSPGGIPTGTFELEVELYDNTRAKRATSSPFTVVAEANNAIYINVTNGTLDGITSPVYCSEHVAATIAVVGNDGYTNFAGWTSSNPGATTIADASALNTTIKATAGATLTAAFSRPAFHVTYDSNGGVGTMTDAADYASGNVVTILPNEFARDGYYFLGWKNQNDEIVSGSFAITENTTLKAQWSAYKTIYLRHEWGSWPNPNLAADSRVKNVYTFSVNGLVLSSSADEFVFVDAANNGNHVYNKTNSNVGDNVGKNSANNNFRLSMADGSYNATITVTIDTVNNGVATVSATYRKASGWYLRHTNDWITGYHVNQEYRGIEDVYYLPMANLYSDKEYKFNFGGAYYGPNGNKTYVVNSKNSVIDLKTGDGSKNFKPTETWSNVWVVLDARASTKKFWIQNPVATYYDVTVTGATEHGSYTLVDNTTDGPVKGTACEKYSANDTYLLTVTVDGCYIPALEVNGAATAWTSVEGQVYTYQAQPTAATTLAVTYSEETKYTVTVTAGAYGTITTPAVLAGSCTSADIVATPAQYFYFNGWTPSANVTLADAEAATTTVNATADGTVTANFKANWSVRGSFNDWNGGDIEVFAGNVGTVSMDLEAKTDYGFKIRDHVNDLWYTRNGANVTRANASDRSITSTDSKLGNVTLKTDVAGRYTFSYNVDTKKLTVTYPAAYSVTFGRGTVKGGEAATAAITDGAALTSGDYVVPSTSVTFTAGEALAGYNYLGWFDNAAGTGVALTTEATYVTTVSVNTAVYAIYAPINYTITYVVNGGDEIAARNYDVATATFDLPIPTRSGYAFRGWYEDAEFKNSTVTQVALGSTGNKTFYAKWKQEGWYLHYQTTDSKWHDRIFSGEPLTVLQAFEDATHDYPMELVKVQDGQDDAYYKNANYMTEDNCSGWNYSTDAKRRGFTSTIAGNYLFTLVVNDGTPNLTLTYPQWGCEFSIPALVNTLQSSTVTFTPTVVNYDVTGYELYYTNDGGANWTSCAGVSESAGVYSYNNTYATAGTYQLKVVVKNGAEQVGEPFLSSEFTVVEPAISIAVSDYPRAGQTVTVTPTVTGLQAGEYHYCWSIVDQTIDFTDNGNGTFSFTAPEAGDYTLRLEVKPGDNCSGVAIISKDQPLTILGDYIVINMKRDPETLWELDNNIYYFQGEGGSFHANAEWPGVAMTFLGKDEDDYPWYTYRIQGYTAYAGGTLIFNDAKVAGEGSMHQTANIAMPQTDACYYVKANLDSEWKRRYELIDDCPDLTRRVVLLSETENQYQGVTYTIKGKAVFFTGNEINYTYSARIKNGADVALDDRHSFIPANAAIDVTYVVSIRATSDAGEDVTSEYEIVMKKNPTTLDITSGSLALNTAMTLTTSRTESFEDGTKFTYTVIEPGTHSQVTFSEVTINSATVSTASGSYTPKSTGTYIFNVIITKGETHVGSAQDSATIAPMKAWVKHNWDGTNWEWKEMTYRNDGTYAYYNADAENGSIYRGETGNAYLKAKEPTGTEGGKTILNPDNLVNVGDHAVFIYDVAANTLTVRPADSELRVYRIKSVCSDGTYYSNTVNANGQKVSFYAQKNGSLTWQSRLSTAISADWEDGATISASISEDNVYTATATTLGSALSAPSVYLGGYTIFSPVVGGHASMTSFTPNPDAANEYFNNYYVLHADDGQALATVGNEINHNLSTVLPYYELPQETNLRYAYNNKTNVFVRNYLADAVGTEGDAPRFLQLYGLASNLKKDDGSTIINKEHPVKLIDQSNWVYTYDATGELGEDDKIMATIRATYNGMQSWILSASGLENDEDADIELLTSKISGAGTYTLRLIYDYKTNRLTAGWIPSGTMNEGVGETITQVRDILVQRRDDGETSQFSIAKGTVVAVDKMTTEFIITREMWRNWGGGTNANGYKTMFFWFSLPYECQLWNVYGFSGAYKVQTAVDVASWEVQRYRGDLRATGSAGSSAWKRLSEYSTTEVNRGYVLAVKLKEADFKDITIDDVTTSEVRFFFPSAGKVTLNTTPTATLPANSGSTAEIQQGWNVMGVPVMKSNCGFTQSASDENKFEYAYRWTWADGGRWYEPFAIQDETAGVGNEKHFNFKSGHAYMVQVKADNTLTWSYDELAGSAWAPARVAANGLTDRNFRVDLYYSDEMQDKTYIKYRTNGTRDYERGRDLEKIENAGRSMIYSELNDKLAAICLADTDYVQIPLTVVAAESGEYVLRLPAAVEGVEPVLYDAQEGVTTMLNYDEYVIDLPAGTYKNRFFLGVEAKSPSVTTSVETVGTDGEKVIKFIDHNNQLMILRAGHLYDAQGHLLK